MQRYYFGIDMELAMHHAVETELFAGELQTVVRAISGAAPHRRWQPEAVALQTLLAKGGRLGLSRRRADGSERSRLPVRDRPSQNRSFGT